MNCRYCEDCILLGNRHACRYSLAEAHLHEADCGLPCPRDLGSLAFSDPEDRATMQTVLLMAERLGQGEQLLSRYPPALREELRRVACSERVSSTVRGHW